MKATIDAVDMLSHDLVELTPVDGVRRRLHVPWSMLLHGDGDCRVQRVASAETARLQREEAAE